MKTNEFLSIFDSNVLVCPIFEVGEVGVKELTYVKIYDSPRLQDSRELAKVWIDRQGVALIDEMAKYPHLVKSIMEYYLTPLEEREEEKKYVLIAPIHKRAEMHLYVYFDDIEKKYYLDDFTNENDQNIFSQKEIDDMPFDTKFFIKEEVK